MSTACSFCDRSAKLLSVSYTEHIRLVRYTSVTRMFVDRSLSVLEPSELYWLQVYDMTH